MTKMPPTLGWLLQLVSLAGATHLPRRHPVTVRSLRSVGTRRLLGLGYLWWWWWGRGDRVLLAGAARPSLQIPSGKAMGRPVGGREGEHSPWQLIVGGGPDSSSWFICCFQASKWVSGE